MNDRQLVLEDVVVPICRAEINPTCATLNLLLGTAFFINSEGYFLTAKHVVDGIKPEAMNEKNTFGLNVKDYDDPTRNLFAKIEKLEFAPQPFDIAIGKVEYKSRSWFDLFNTQVEGWLDIATLGYPKTALNVDSQKFNIHTRMLKGFIQRPIPIDELATHKPHPRCFELSFPITNGLSGSPLFVPRDKQQFLIGVCTHSYDAEIIVDEITEIDESGKKLTERRSRVEQYGIAHSIADLANWKPIILEGKSLGEAVKAYY